MEQHPVPQPITSYEFRLVGNMTLKQFGKLAAGIILALIVYGINPPGFIKWPLIGLFAGFGAAMAFVPFEGRPIDIWIIAFFKRIYSPTMYLWQTKNKSSVVNTAKTSAPPKTTISFTPAPATATPVAPKIEPVKPAATKPPVPPTATVTTPPRLYKQTGIGRPQMPYIPPRQEFTKVIFKENKVDAKFVPEMVIPATPSMPNLIVGYIHTADQKIVDSAIMEIRDGQGNPVRALKSNRLGQFLTATPLPSGDYEIEIEKEGLNFDIIKVKLEGKIIPPIEIISK